MRISAFVLYTIVLLIKLIKLAMGQHPKHNIAIDQSWYFLAHCTTEIEEE